VLETAPAREPTALVTSANVVKVTADRDAAREKGLGTFARELTREDAAAAARADAQRGERVKKSRAALRKREFAETGTKLAIVGALASTATTLTKDLPLVGGAIAGVIMLVQMGLERKYIGKQAKAAAKDILHDLTYSYLLFKLIDIGADKLGLVLDIEVIQEGIKDIREKVNAQLAERPDIFKHPTGFIKYQSRNPKIELELLHKSLDEFRDNMVDLYTSFDVLKKTDELLPTLTAEDKPGIRYANIDPSVIGILIAWFKTAAARELDDDEVSEVMKFLEEKLMLPGEAKAKNDTVKGADVVPDADADPLQRAREAAAAGVSGITSYIPMGGGGALWPPKYYRGLSTRRKGQRRREITRRAKMSHKNPAAYRPFATDRGTKRRPSSYTSRFHSKYPGVTGLPAIAKATGVPQSVLEKVYDRGLAAWRTGHRPGASQHAWGMARVYSFVLHGKTWRTADADLARRNSSH
jgi:hypothetical protein